MKSITCDNASNNDTMVDALKDRLEIFPGASNCTRCFDHIVNLVAKSVICQFDIPKTKGNESFDDVLRELMVTAKDLDEEELAMREGEESDDESDDDNVDGFMNELEEMSEVEQKELDDSIQPI
jgi:predicted CopG family antitoxin